jgi:rod shape-determining protein MreB
MFEQFLNRYSRDVSIDLGTANTLFYTIDGNIILNEPSVVALRTDRGSDQVIAVGQDAKHMLGRTPDNLKAIRPLKDGVIADFMSTEKMLQHFFKKVQKRQFFMPRPRVVVCVPCGSTQVERRAIRESIYSAGARAVYVIEEPMAAAIGANLPVGEPMASMIVDIGGGTTEVAIISLNGIVYSESVRIGGDLFDQSIMNYVRRNFGSLIGESTAETIKKQIGTAFPDKEVARMEVSGRNVAEGIPRTIAITSNEVLEALQDPLSGMIAAIRRALEHAPPELSGDIASKGMVLTGGGALLKGIDQMISEETSLPVTVADDPLTCVARGGGYVLQDLDRLSAIFAEHE